MAYGSYSICAHGISHKPSEACLPLAVYFLPRQPALSALDRFQAVVSMLGSMRKEGTRFGMIQANTY